VVVSCGHSFGGLMLRRVLDMVSRIICYFFFMEIRSNFHSSLGRICKIVKTLDALCFCIGCSVIHSRQFQGMFHIFL
jgi:hypothetical protein